MQKLGVTVDDNGVTFEMEGSASSLTSLMVSLLAKFAKEMKKTGINPDVFIWSIAEGAKREIKEGRI